MFIVGKPDNTRVPVRRSHAVRDTESIKPKHAFSALLQVIELDHAVWKRSEDGQHKRSDCPVTVELAIGGSMKRGVGGVVVRDLVEQTPVPNFVKGQSDKILHVEFTGMFWLIQSGRGLPL